jgi:ubiquinone/menaquinone biosynthesis C-methylase UbiE
MDYRNVCFKIYRKLQSLIAPNLKYSQSIYEGVLNEVLSNNCSWLELGCGHQILPPWRYEQEQKLTKRTIHIVGLDYDFNSLQKHKTIDKRVRGDIGQLPFGNAHFDIVTSNMVFEHLKNPAIQLEEIFRVLKPGGILVFHTPNVFSYDTIAAMVIPEIIKAKLVWFFQGRAEEDVFPAYYKINTTGSIQQYAKSAGFEIIQIKMITSSAQFVMIPPLVVLELILIRILMSDRMKFFRPNIIAKLKKNDNV